MTSSVGSSAFADFRRRAAGRRSFAVPVSWVSEAREDPDGVLLLRGLAAVFDSESLDLGGFTETIAPGAFSRALRAPGSDQFLLWSHDPDAILARRSAGTLDLKQTDRGLEIEARLVPTQLARDVHLLVRTGHADGMSFGFTVARDEWSGSGKSTRRRITEIGSLFEVTVTPNPAYPMAGASARSRVELARELEVMKVRARKRLAEINNQRQGQQMVSTSRKSSKSNVSVKSVRDPYLPGSPHSYFGDRLAIASDEARVAAGSAHAPGFGRAASDARSRMAAHSESRALNTTAGSGGDFLPTGAIPASVASAFGTSARAQAVVSALLPTFALPDASGMTIDLPRFTSNALVGVQAAQGDSVSSSTPATALASSPIVILTGEVEVSQKALDRAVPNGFDTAIGAELGVALGSRVEAQVLGGSGASGQLSGLLGLASTAITYTSSSPTVAGVVSKLGETLSGVHQAIGTEPDLVAVHPRRAFWMTSQSDSAGQPVQMRLGVPVVAAAGMPLDGSSRDQALVLRTSGVRLYLSAPSVSVVSDYSGSSTMTAKVVAYQYAALVLVKGGACAGKLSGSGLSSPTFT